MRPSRCLGLSIIQPTLCGEDKTEIEAGSDRLAALWALEMANGLFMAERRGKLTSQESITVSDKSEILLLDRIHTGSRPFEMLCRSAIVPVDSLRRSM
jgi:hypothetical protein